MEEKKRKLFVIGWQKTGTTSLGYALKKLGYDLGGGVRINHPRGVAIEPPVTLDKVWDAVLPFAEAHEAFEDNPWPLLYERLDRQFPGSRFILTWRQPDHWLASMKRHFGLGKNKDFPLLYGHESIVGHEAAFLRVYREHADNVRAYFHGRSADFLEMDLEAGDGWPVLCRFLGVAVPNDPFPRRNTAEERERKKKNIWRRLRRGVRELFKKKP